LDDNGDRRYVSFENTLLLCNTLIEEGSMDLGRSICFLQNMSNHIGMRKQIVVCSHCAKKVGIKMCSACPKDSKVRYCSRDCQLAAWPTHKELCGVLEAEDVE
jgi:hypothetical protein